MTDAERTRRAAEHPNRPGEQCEAPAGKWRPTVNRAKCEGKAACVVVCPYRVFQVGRISDEELAAQPFLVRLKLRAHGRKTAYTPNADACQACGMCVVACPEDAITLVRASAEG